MKKEDKKLICSRGEVVKERVHEVMKKLYLLQDSKVVSKTDDSFARSLQLLEKKNFCIAVCGEVSQGKSQFINAFIGRNILPIDQHSTTSQILKFPVQNRKHLRLYLQMEHAN